MRKRVEADGIKAEQNAALVQVSITFFKKSFFIAPPYFDEKILSHKKYDFPQREKLREFFLYTLEHLQYTLSKQFLLTVSHISAIKRITRKDKVISILLSG